jgi:glycerol uptake facilitator-like aquaporin
MRDSLRHFVAEFIGTFALVFVGGATIIGATGTQMDAALVAVALAHGLVLAVFVSATMRISGHFNPAVTIGFLAARRIEPIMAGVYIAAQILAALLASYALKALMPAALATATRFGGQAIASEVTITQAIGLEAIATFFLVFVIFGTAVDPKARSRPRCCTTRSSSDANASPWTTALCGRSRSWRATDGATTARHAAASSRWISSARR